MPETMHGDGRTRYGLQGGPFSALQLLLLAGAVISAAGEDLGAVVLLAGLGAMLLGHLLVGVAGYRRVMRRPWPPVEPLPDDDDW